MCDVKVSNTTKSSAVMMSICRILQIFNEVQSSVLALKVLASKNRKLVSSSAVFGLKTFRWEVELLIEDVSLKTRSIWTSLKVKVCVKRSYWRVKKI